MNCKRNAVTVGNKRVCLFVFLINYELRCFITFFRDKIKSSGPMLYNLLLLQIRNVPNKLEVLSLAGFSNPF